MKLLIVVDIDDINDVKDISVDNTGKKNEQLKNIIINLERSEPLTLYNREGLWF